MDEPNRSKLVAVMTTPEEHRLIHVAARLDDASASTWGRRVLVQAARKRFRAALREAQEGDGAVPVEPVEA